MVLHRTVAGKTRSGERTCAPFFLDLGRITSFCSPFALGEGLGICGLKPGAQVNGKEKAPAGSRGRTADRRGVGWVPMPSDQVKNTSRMAFIPHPCAKAEEPCQSEACPKCQAT